MSTADFPSPILLEQESYVPLQRSGFADAAGPDLSKEAIWLLSGLLLCAFLIIGCACCSLRFTQLQHRRRIELEDAEAANGLRPKFRSSVNGASAGGSFGAEISYEFDNSMDMTSTSAK